MKKPYRFIETNDQIHLYMQRNVTYVAPHWHKHYEITICLDGKAWSIVNNERSFFTKGSLIFVTPSDFHSFEIISPLQLAVITFDISGLPYTALTEILYSVNCKSINLSENEFNDIKFFVSKLQEELNSGCKFSSYYAKNIFSCILIELFRHNDDTHSHSDTTKMKKILHYINSHFKEEITLKDVADYAEVSYSNIGKYIKTHLGETFPEYLNKVRLEYSCQLLLNSTETISDIANFSGFSSSSYFSKIFKSKYGITPQEYRKRAK